MKEHRAARGNPDAARVFDVADRDLGVGDVFRWPHGAGSRRWRIAAIVAPDVDALTQRVRAVPVEEDTPSSCAEPEGEW